MSSKASSELKLHLGCGDKRWDGWVNVDLAGEVADLHADVMDELPWDDGTVSEIAAIHVFEHVPLPLARRVLTEWVRVLRPGGVLTLEMPCRDKVFTLIADGVRDEQMVLWPLYGEPRTMKCERDVHKWCWSKVELATLMQKVGLVDIESQPPQFHVPERDMRFQGRKA